MRNIHGWRVSPERAREIQGELARQVTEKPLPRALRRVAGVDVAFVHGGDRAVAAVVVFSLPELRETERVVAEGSEPFAYVPGLLTFREGPVVIKALRRLRTAPDAILVDGQGIAHPRGMEIAAHLGLWAGLPSVGCAKSALVRPVREPGLTRGSRAPIVKQGRTVGFSLRTRAGVKPVYVSPGHLADLEGSVALVLRCSPRFRIPEPLRAAHSLSTAEARARELLEMTFSDARNRPI